MTTYWAILEKMRGSKLRLTKIDDEIYEHFKNDFPEFDPAATIDEDKMKSKEGKERWRNFMMAYEKKIDDYNFGTMLRANPKTEYGEKETIFGTWSCKAQLERERFIADSMFSYGSYEDAVLRSGDSKVMLDVLSIAMCLNRRCLETAQASMIGYTSKSTLMRPKANPDNTRGTMVETIDGF